MVREYEFTPLMLIHGSKNNFTSLFKIERLIVAIKKIIKLCKENQCLKMKNDIFKAGVELIILVIGYK